MKLNLDLATSGTFKLPE